MREFRISKEFKTSEGKTHSQDAQAIDGSPDENLKLNLRQLGGARFNRGSRSVMIFTKSSVVQNRQSCSSALRIWAPAPGRPPAAKSTYWKGAGASTRLGAVVPVNASLAHCGLRLLVTTAPGVASCVPGSGFAGSKEGENQA